MVAKKNESIKMSQTYKFLYLTCAHRHTIEKVLKNYCTALNVISDSDDGS